MNRRDYAFPFHIAPVSKHGAQTDYANHVEQMIRQVLLTDPGERADLPEFGCGLRRLLFTPLSDVLTATTRIQVQQALNLWLSTQIQVQSVNVISSGQIPDSALLVQISYILLQTRTSQSTEVQVI